MKPESVKALGGIPVDVALPDEPDIGGMLIKAAHGMVDHYRKPEEQAFLAGVVLTSAFTVTRAGFGPISGGLIAFVGGLAAKRAYLAMADLRYLADTTREHSQPDPG